MFSCAPEINCKNNGQLCIGFLADWKCLAPVAAASPERSAGIQRRTGTNINSCTGSALQKKNLIVLKKQVTLRS
jgi:hypothetical protein